MKRRSLFRRLYGLYLLMTFFAVLLMTAYASSLLLDAARSSDITEPESVSRSARLGIPMNADTAAAAGVLAADSDARAAATSVSASRPDPHASARIRSARERLILVGALAMLSLALAGFIVFRRFTLPLTELMRGAERFARGELNHRIPESGGDELASVGAALNEMARTMEERVSLLGRERAEQETILANLLEGVILLDADGRVLSINRIAASFAGLEPEPTVGMPIEAVLRYPAVQSLVAGAAASPAVATDPVEIDISGRSIRVQATRLRNIDGSAHGTILVLNDITRLRRLERVRRDFVANVSHELKTPITAIKGYIEALHEGAANDPETSRRFLEIALKQADRLNAIIEDLLSLSRFESESAGDSISLETNRLVEILAAAIETCSDRAAKRQIRVELECAPELAAKVNRPLLEQAVVNLIDNAVKYSEPGSLVRVSAFDEDLRTVILVADHGCGIAAEHLPRLFERFYRVDKARSRTMGGTGLGLAIVKHIALAHGGTVAVESVVGRGSIFTISLPHITFENSV